MRDLDIIKTISTELGAALKEEVTRLDASVDKKLEPLAAQISEVAAAVASIEVVAGADGAAGEKGEKGDTGERGEDGKSVDAKEVATIILSGHYDELRGEDGVSPEVKDIVDVLVENQDFIKAVTPNIHPKEVADQLVELHLSVIKGIDGANGIDGEDGANGFDGVGIDAVPYVENAVYREGTVVIANIGQYFKACRDTVKSPNESDDWTRIGNHGFRHVGVYDQNKTYADGDIFTKDFGSFFMANGEPVLLSGRGAKGERGAVGPSGAAGLNGKDGRNGSQIVGCSVAGFKAVIVMESFNGAIDHVELDFEPAFKEQIDAVKVELLDYLREQHD